MRRLSTATDVLPYTPNTDTIYSGALLDLVDEPIILTVPDILDRYWSIQVVDAYTENRIYIGSRKHDGYGGNHAFVGPRFRGQLPDNVVEHRVPYNSLMMALRIAVDQNNQVEDTKKVVEIQNRCTTTSLSNWVKGKIGETSVPESVKAKSKYPGDPLGNILKYAINVLLFNN